MLSHETEIEPVLAVPPKLTKSTYAILLGVGGVAQRWHTEGRYGSRTHPVGDGRMGIPLLPGPAQDMASFMKEGKEINKEPLTWNDDLKELLTKNGVSIVYKTVPTPKNIPRNESIDATVHPERARPLPRRFHASSKPQVSSENSDIPAFTFAELFCGIGGFGVALEAIGGQCVFASEVDQACRRVYAENVNVPPQGIHGDIYMVPDEALPSHDLLVAGFPCQPFSSLGNQPGFTDETRGLLYTQIVRVLRVCQPQAFLLENVPGMLGVKSALSTIVSSLEEVGYNVTVEVCSSRCLVAHSRKRLYFVGLLRSSETDPKNEASNFFEFPYIPDLGVRCADILEYDHDCDPSLEPCHLTNDQMNQLLACREKKRKWKPAKLAWPDAVCDTLDGHYGVCVGKGNSQLVPCPAPHYPRKFTLRECARIMGFPNSFCIPSRRQGQGQRAFLKEHYRMFGNAVCPPVVAVLAGAILAHCPDLSRSCNWAEWGLDRGLFLALNSVTPHGKKRIEERLCSKVSTNDSGE